MGNIVGNLRKTTEEYKEEAIAIHGDKCCYDRVVYKGKSEPIELFCNISQSWFWQRADLHLLGTGVNPEISRILATERTRIKFEKIFIEESQQIHNNIYGYDKVKYVNGHTPVEIYCNIHKEYFWQRPDIHKKATGCQKCSAIKRANDNRRTTAEYIAEAEGVHGIGTYGYDKVEYTGANDYVMIKCPKHGYFKQRAQGHLLGKGCLACSGREKLTKEIFIARAEKIHGIGTYNYDAVDYINIDTKVKIWCNKHQVFFWQTPDAHIGKRKHGGPYCKASKGELVVLNVLKEFEIVFERQFRFSDCRGTRRVLPFDFAIFINDKLKLIEYQGEQHYQPMRYSKNREKNLEAFRMRLFRDNIKKTYCEDKEIDILYLKYNENDTLRENLLKFCEINLENTCQNL